MEGLKVGGRVMPNVSILSQFDAERLVTQLKKYDIKEIGSTDWVKQLRAIQRLNAQAHVNISTTSEEFISAALISHDKMSILVHSLLVSESFRKKILPLHHTGLKREHIMRIYWMLFHEAVVMNLLENICNVPETCSEMGDAMIDLIDYCCRCCINLIEDRSLSAPEEEIKDEEGKPLARTPIEELARMHKDIRLRTCVSAVGVLRYITQNSSELSIGAVKRLMKTNDLPQILIALVENPPWTRRSADRRKWEKFIDNEWKVIVPRDLMKLTPLEGQMWIIFLQLFVFGTENELPNNYELHGARKARLLTLRKYVQPLIVDQVPGLEGLQRFLDELQVMEVPEATQLPSSFLLETVPMFDEEVYGNKNWAEILEKHILPTLNSKDYSDLKILGELYIDDDLSAVLETPKCAVCGEAAMKRCSRCKNEWYCTRECQVKAWKKHKPVCDVVVQNSKKK
eukprot:TRINITY_DN5208_c0_g1_i1.p1 TRINITY_DN5208_c0_g1~~TRINITY_DN5208_c0_g1_i1.p1  ORF type:complete len:456 (+),score=103.82 TRINITY_DN5208_c0_g1_i1:53-1420(+)